MLGGNHFQGSVWPEGHSHDFQCYLFLFMLSTHRQLTTHTLHSWAESTMWQKTPPQWCINDISVHVNCTDLTVLFGTSSNNTRRRITLFLEGSQWRPINRSATERPIGQLMSTTLQAVWHWADFLHLHPPPLSRFPHPPHIHSPPQHTPPFICPYTHCFLSSRRSHLQYLLSISCVLTELLASSATQSCYVTCDYVRVCVCFLGRGRGLEEEDIIDNFVVPVNVVTLPWCWEGWGWKMYTHTHTAKTQILSNTNRHWLSLNGTFSMWQQVPTCHWLSHQIVQLAVIFLFLSPGPADVLANTLPALAVCCFASLFPESAG